MIRAADAAWSLTSALYVHAGASRAAVDGVTIEVPAGRLTALIGPNGAGKSTLLSLMLGVARPDSGNVRFRGRAVADWPRAELARTVGVLSQGEELTFPMSVRSLVEMGRYPHLGPWRRIGRVDREAIDAALARCDVAPLAERGVGTLSSGERQRARLARALAQIGSPSLRGGPAPGSALALDEPTASLDLAHEMSFFDLARALSLAGTTVLLATHNLNLAARYADHLVLLDAGRVAAAGAPRDVLTAEIVSRVYGWPVTVEPYRGSGSANGAPQIVPLDAGAESGRGATGT